jgi:hypothetical protein
MHSLRPAHVRGNPTNGAIQAEYCKECLLRLPTASQDGSVSVFDAAGEIYQRGGDDV